MEHKVVNKQLNARNCFACGVDNPYGLRARFYELDNGELAAVFTPDNLHQSYPGRLHGGISAAILDETIGRAIMISEPDVWGVTAALSLRYKKPVPLGTPLTVIGRITRNSRRIFEGTGEILLPDGGVAVTAEGKYMKMTIDQITTDEFIKSEEMHLEEDPDDPIVFDYE
jgi:acyl-coenzyme A thioesterase PaaI-like protein